MIQELIDRATVEELTAGYLFDEERQEYICLICGNSYKRHYVYNFGETTVEAAGAAELHLAESHGSSFESFIRLHKRLTGLTENQREMLDLFYQGLSDREIRERLDNVALSTIRNYRFSLREKRRQAKLFLALMEGVERSGRRPEEGFVPIPGSRLSEDDRFAITREEYDRILGEFFPDGKEGALLRLPKRQKQMIAVLLNLLERFDQERVYSQNEVNRILEKAHGDYVTLRRYMVDYGFLNRRGDGSAYWVRIEG
jgi:DNA-binding CsgD family transcriptional regulator